MNCTKCGKEIPDGENTLCKECQKKESKKEKSGEGKKNNVIIIIIAIIVILALLVGGYLLFGRNNKIGNSIGNIRNYGYSCTQGNWIYYVAPNEDSSKIGIYKVKTNGSDKKELYMSDADILSLNVCGNYLYFIGVGAETFTEEDEVDNKIYRMKLNGSDLQVINDNEFNNNCYEIYVINNSVYYIGVDANIYKMKLDGSDKTVVTENGTGYLGITKDSIIYNKMEENSSDYVTYIMNIDGSNERPILEGKRLYSVNVEKDYIYYTNEDKQIYKTKIDSGNEELVLDTTAYNLNLKDNYLYYLNYLDFENEDLTVCIFRIKTDGSSQEPEKVKTLETYSSFIDVVGNWVVYLDSTDNSAYIKMVKVDGSKEEELFSLNYDEQNVEENQDAVSNETTEGNTETTEPVETPENTNEVDTNTVVDTNNTTSDTNNVSNETADTNTAAAANETSTENTVQ